MIDRGLLRLFAMLFACTCAFAQGQVSVDATVPIHNRPWNPDAGEGGGVGRRLPLAVTVKPMDASPDSKGRTKIEFVLTNSGKENLSIPISPHPGDLEPPSPEVEYSVTHLSLFLSEVHSPGSILSGGADLFGAAKLAGTLVPLSPGSSLHVIAYVSLPFGSAMRPDEMRLIAGAILNIERVEKRDGRMLSTLHEIGSAFSKEIELHTLIDVR